MNRHLVKVIFLLLLLAGGCRREASLGVALDPARLPGIAWGDLQAWSRGSSVNYAMWSGDEARNRYFRGPVAEAVRQKFGITLRIVPLGDAAEAVNKLLNEKGAGRTSNGSIDMIWINGENFRTAKQGGVLWGPFADFLPHIRFYAEAARGRDFGTPIEGYEAPWLRAQFVMAYDTARMQSPPLSIPALGEWIKAHPGRFTYPAPPDFTGSVFLRHILFHFGGGAGKFQDGFDEARYRQAAEATIAFLNDLKPYLWRSGKTYPSSLREADRLFVNNEIDFTMSYGPSFASERIARGEYPPTVRTFVFESGTIGNYNYLAIPFNAANPAGALVVIDYLMSAEALIDQCRVLGTLLPLELDRLTEEERAAADSLPRGPATLPADVLAKHLAPEADVRYLERLEKDWFEKVLQK